MESEGKTAEEVLAEKKAIGEADDDELPPELRMEEYDNEEDGVLFSRDDLGGIEDEDSEDGMTVSLFLWYLLHTLLSWIVLLS